MKIIPKYFLIREDYGVPPFNELGAEKVGKREPGFDVNKIQFELDRSSPGVNLMKFKSPYNRPSADLNIGVICKKL